MQHREKLKLPDHGRARLSKKKTKKKQTDTFKLLTLQVFSCGITCGCYCRDSIDDMATSGQPAYCPKENQQTNKSLISVLWNKAAYNTSWY